MEPVVSRSTPNQSLDTPCAERKRESSGPERNPAGARKCIWTIIVYNIQPGGRKDAELARLAAELNGLAAAPERSTP